VMNLTFPIIGLLSGIWVMWSDEDLGGSKVRSMHRSLNVRYHLCFDLRLHIHFQFHDDDVIMT
jgi:hypothetical protein